MKDLVMNASAIVVLVVFLIALSGCAIATDLVACTINVCN
jgi:hypothetical protein